ncbi:hypothetical protein SIID45300_02272 [Candidatus Magnetaquicoccaceae bacterium FCR-1]|uniref:Uncharacterized protein n=1 Tax=Candidatus Magnetaquiglobus chichijimensis TaxID=3141448 RepID=A0ABQ0CAN9_9PROT
MIGTPRLPRSCLARLIPERMDVELEKRKGWHTHGILVVAENDPRLGWPEREMIRHLASKLFGKQAVKEVAHG